MVSASSRSSSGGPPTPSRACRLSPEIERVCAVMVRSGASTRPATSQPRPADSSAISASATTASITTDAIAIYAIGQHEPYVLPTYALIVAPVAGFAIGALAGLYPAGKAARLSPTEALRS
jgi:hypothetical protein